MNLFKKMFRSLNAVELHADSFIRIQKIMEKYTKMMKESESNKNVNLLVSMIDVFKELDCQPLFILKTPRAGDEVDNGYGVEFSLSPYAIIYEGDFDRDDPKDQRRSLARRVYDWERRNDTDLMKFSIDGITSIEELIKELYDMDGYEVIWSKKLMENIVKSFGDVELPVLAILKVPKENLEESKEVPFYIVIHNSSNQNEYKEIMDKYRIVDELNGRNKVKIVTLDRSKILTSVREIVRTMCEHDGCELVWKGYER